MARFPRISLTLDLPTIVGKRGESLSEIKEHYDAFLTGEIEEVWPTAEVRKIDYADGTCIYFIRRPGEPDLSIGPTFRAARRAVKQIVEKYQEW